MQTQKDSDSENTTSPDPLSCQCDLSVDIFEPRAWFDDKIRKMNEDQHKLNKLAGLDELLDQKVGKEEQTYRKICKKYNESPQPYPGHASPQTAPGG